MNFKKQRRRCPNKKLRSSVELDQSIFKTQAQNDKKTIIILNMSKVETFNFVSDWSSSSETGSDDEKLNQNNQMNFSIFQPNHQTVLDSVLENSLFKPPKLDQIKQFSIYRNKKGIKNKLNPIFYIKEKDSTHFILKAKRESKNGSSKYIISLNPDISKGETDNSLGYLLSDYKGIEFNLCKKNNNCLSELAYIKYVK